MSAKSPTVVPFRPPQRRRIHEDVAAQLRDAILDGRFRVGRKLPPERELAEEFRVNRTSVREAIKVLEGLGLVSVRQGDGATVQPLTDAAFDVLGPMIFHGGRIDEKLMLELVEVTTPLLLEMGRLAIERYRPEHLAELHRLRDVMADDDREREDRFAASRDLIVYLSDMTGNRVWQMLTRRTRTFLASEPLRQARQRLRRDPGRLVPLIDTCVNAMAAGRPGDALKALHGVIALVGASELHVGPSRTYGTAAR